MGQRIKIKCNGEKKHVNEFDIDRVVEETSVLRDILLAPATLQDRYVFRCCECVANVIITKRMIEDAQR